MSSNCKNCDKPLPGQAEFCPACGQSIKVVTRPWSEVFHELVKELFDFDGRMFVSLRLLMTRPGFLCLEYINDRRLSYTSPIRMYLVVSLVFFFVLPMILPESDPATSSHAVSVDQYSQAMFLLVPVFGLLMKLLYRQVYYLAHLVFVLYLFSAMYIVFAFILATETAADRYLAVVILQLVFLVYMLVYFAKSLRVVYQEKWSKTVLKSVALLVCFANLVVGVIKLASYFNLTLPG